MNIAVLMTCHNRRETTLRCLRTLADAAKEVENEVERRGGGGQWNLRVFLVDDGSTDGTGEAVRNVGIWEYEIGEVGECANGGMGKFAVKGIRGDGNLFWAKGMELAWREALKYETALRSTSTTPTFNYDAFLWLNDDVELRPDALRRLSDFMRADRRSAPTEQGADSAVVVGELENARGEIVYGKRGDLFTGNVVLVPRDVYEKVGMICGAFAHAWADSDYALRCKRAGVPVVSCGVVGASEGHPNRPSLKGVGLGRRWGMLWDSKGWCVHDLWLYRRRNWGVMAAVFSCAHLVLHVLWGERG